MTFSKLAESIRLASQSGSQYDYPEEDYEYYDDESDDYYPEQQPKTMTAPGMLGFGLAGTGLASLTGAFNARDNLLRRSISTNPTAKSYSPDAIKAGNNAFSSYLSNLPSSIGNNIAGAFTGGTAGRLAHLQGALVNPLTIGTGLGMGAYWLYNKYRQDPDKAKRLYRKYRKFKESNPMMSSYVMPFLRSQILGF